MQRILVKDALNATSPCDAILLQGWVRTRRDAKAFSFIELNDGSCLKGLQVIVDATLPDYPQVARANTGASIEVHGKLVESKGQGQKWEVVAEKFAVLGEADASYPLQKKGHSLEFLREIAHLRPRSNLFGAVFRVRSRLAYAVHQFFQDKNFFYIHAPIITASDAEGAGEMFRVTTLNVGNPPKPEQGEVDNTKDFFGKKTFLTVSGQLEGEIFAMALSNIYTFGPTFRAENSHTSRHAAEFWMIEPEIAFCDLAGNMALAEEFVATPGNTAPPTSSFSASSWTRNCSPGSTSSSKGLSSAAAIPRRSEFSRKAERLGSIRSRGATISSRSMNASSRRNILNAPSQFIITRAPSKPFTCESTTVTPLIARRSRRWICWCRASAKLSAAASVRSGWNCLRLAWRCIAFPKKTTGGISTFADTAACRMRASVSDLNAC
jgi:hypothetical protein